MDTPAPRSYKVEVQADSTGTWAGNGLRFATEGQANAYGFDLACRWTAVREYRVEPSDDEPNQGEG